MSDEKRSVNDMDVTQFDKMSLDELEEILRQDAVFGETNENSVDELIYIMGLVADKKRAEDPSAYTNVEEAKKSFEENYLPIAARGEALFEEEVSEPEAKIQSGTHRRFFRTAIAIAAVVALLLTGSLFASALGFNVWNHVADWTRDVFGYGEKYEADDVIGEFSALLSQNGVDPAVLPTYIPDGYEVVSVDKFSDSAYSKYQCELSNGHDSIILEYLIGAKEYADVFFKDEEQLDVRTYNGTDFYFICNDCKNYVTWTSGEIDGSIFYTDPGLDIERIIKSISGE